MAGQPVSNGSIALIGQIGDVKIGDGDQADALRIHVRVELLEVGEWPAG